MLVVVLTITHRYNAVRGHRTGSNNSGAEYYLRRSTNKNRRWCTQQLKNILYLRRKKVRSAYVRIEIHIYHMLNESQQKPKPKRQHSTHEKKTGWNKRCPKRNKKQEQEEKKKNGNSTSTTQRRRRQHARGIHISQARKERGGVAPSRKNRITVSTAKDSRESTIKAKKAIEESNGKRQDEMTKNERKRNKEWDTEND